MLEKQNPLALLSSSVVFDGEESRIPCVTFFIWCLHTDIYVVIDQVIVHVNIMYDKVTS